MYYATEHNQNEINKVAKLSDMQSRQVKSLNMSYNDRANAILTDPTITEDDRKQKLVTLNTERREKIKVLVGKNKEKNLEKARVKYSAKNATDKQSEWLNQVAANNK
jgi:exosome complex RNA-binding protein Rrp42 (RNase PH superfamily)